MVTYFPSKLYPSLVKLVLERIFLGNIVNGLYFTGKYYL